MTAEEGDALPYRARILFVDQRRGEIVVGCVWSRTRDGVRVELMGREEHEANSVVLDSDNPDFWSEADERAYDAGERARRLLTDLAGRYVPIVVAQDESSIPSIGSRQERRINVAAL
jgi:hypothetical protein